MNNQPSLLPPGYQVGNCRISSALSVGDHYADYKVSDLSGGRISVIREFMPSRWAVRDAATGEWICPLENREGFAREKAEFEASINPEGLCGTLDALNTVFLMYGVPAAAPAMPLPGQKAPVKKPAAKPSGGCGMVFWVLLLVLALLGGGGYYAYRNYAEQQEKARLEAEAMAREEAARQEAELARRRAEEARLKAEEERRRLADQAKDKDRDQPVDVVKGDAVPQKPDTPSDEPAKRVPAPDADPRLAVFDKTIPLTGVNATSKKANEVWDNAVETAFETYRFDKYRDFLGRSLKETCSSMVSSNKFDMKKFYESPRFRQAMKDYKFLSAFPAQETIMEALNDDLGSSFYKYLLADQENSLTLFLQSLDGSETPEKVARILKDWMPYWKNEAGDKEKKYLSLGLACALVEPSTLGAAKTSYEQALSMPEVYNMFREKSRAGKLQADITKMRPVDLVHVVNLRLPLSEIEWAQSNQKLRKLNQKRWGDAYGMVRYRMDRAVHGVNPYKDYKFAEILEEGGICMDQAYFAANTAKSNGIPAIYITGDGARGPHAWIAYMPDDHTWANAGSYGYTSGKTVDPKSGQLVHESTFLLGTDKKTSGDRLGRTLDYVEVSNLLEKLGMDQAALNLLTLAQLNTPSHPLPWRETIRFYSRPDNKTTLEQWEFLVDTFRRKFKDRPDYLSMAEEIENKYIFPNKSAVETANDLARQRRKLDRDTGEGRSDLAADAVKRQAEFLKEGGKVKELELLYKKAMKDYGDRPDAFKSVISQYFSYASADTEWQKRAVKDIERAFEKYINTKTDDYFRAKQEVGIMDMVAGFYRQAGDEKKADALKKKGESRMKKIKRTVKEEH